jgi:hypothetical protein
MVRGVSMVNANERVLMAGVGWVESVAWIVTWKVADLVGAPTMVPERRRERPSGRAPPVTVQV